MPRGSGAGRAAVDEALERRFRLEPFVDHLALELGLRPRSCSAYRSDLRRFLAFIARGARDGRSPPGPRDIDYRILREHLAALRHEGSAATTIRRAQSALKAYFTFLAGEGVIGENPTDRLEGISAERKLPEFLTRDEAARLVEAVDPDSPVHWRDRAILELLYATGMRVSELTGLTLDHLDLDDGSCLIFGKGGRERLVPVGGAAVRTARRYLQARAELDRGVAMSRGAVFLNRRGGPLTRMSVWTIVRRAADRAGINRKVSPHTLRHTCATHLVEGGADLFAVRELLGHADVATTQIYTHLDTQHLRRVHERHHPRMRGG